MTNGTNDENIYVYGKFENSSDAAYPKISEVFDKPEQLIEWVSYHRRIKTLQIVGNINSVSIGAVFNYCNLMTK